MTTRALRQFRRPQAAALATVIVALGLLTAIIGSLLFVVTNRFSTLHQSSVWQEALVAGEAGVHQGMAQLERALKQNSLPTGAQTFTIDLPHVGETSSLATVQYTLTRNDVTSFSRTRPFFSIVSTGTVTIPGRSSLSVDSRDAVLRKLDLGTGTRHARRTIEAWAKPLFSTDTALQVDQLITLNNHKIYIDSFNSSDPNRSLAGGLPGTAMGQFNVAPFNVLAAHIATNSQFISAGDATVYGDALTNGGTVGGSDGILGEIRDDFYQPLAPVFPPTWASSVTPGVKTDKKSNVVNVTSAATLRGGTADAPGRYIVDSVSLAGNADVLTFDFGLNGNNGAKDPQKKYVELYVRGDVSTKGGGNESGSVVIVKGVEAKIWILGSATFTGNGVANNNSLASALSLYGINAPVAPLDQTFTLSGTARFFGTVYAPAAGLKLAGSGSDGMFVGSLVGKSAFLNGHTKIRYDEALAGTGLIKRFELISWFEDTKKHGAFTGKL